MTQLVRSVKGQSIFDSCLLTFNVFHKCADFYCPNKIADVVCQCCHSNGSQILQEKHIGVNCLAETAQSQAPLLLAAYTISLL